MDSLNILFCNIAGLRRYYGYSKKYMATLLGIGVKTLDKIEAGVVPPRLSAEILVSLYRHFHILPAALLSQQLFAQPQLPT